MEMNGIDVCTQTAHASLAARIKSLAGFRFVPKDVLDAMDRLWTGGFGVWIVGGSLRDFLMGRPIKDWDLATTASPEQVAGIFPRVIPVGIRFGTVVIHSSGRDIEVTSCSGGGGIIRDLNRRDFTVNAFGLAYPEGGFLDLNGGMEDLVSGTLRCVGNARLRFREDGLRILRACRFVSVLGFRVHPSAKEGMKVEAAVLGRVAPERIRDEMVKILLGKHVVRSLEMMRRVGVLGMVLPELDEGYRRKRNRSDGLDAFHETLYAVRKCPERVRVRLSALFHRIGELPVPQTGGRRAERWNRRAESSRVAARVMQRWRMSRKEIREVSLLVGSQLGLKGRESAEAELRRLYGQLGLALVEDLMALAQVRFGLRPSRDLLLQRIRCLQGAFSRIAGEKRLAGVKDLAVGGNDVMEALGLPPGPLIGRILATLYRKVLDDPAMNDYERLMKLLKVDSRGILAEILAGDDPNAGRSG